MSTITPRPQSGPQVPTFDEGLYRLRIGDPMRWAGAAWLSSSQAQQLRAALVARLRTIGGVEYTFLADGGVSDAVTPRTDAATLLLAAAQA